MSKIPNLILDNKSESDSEKEAIVNEKVDRCSLPINNEHGPIYQLTKRQWELIFKNWKDGWHSETTFERLDNYLESKRIELHEKAGDEKFDSEMDDWFEAINLHDHNKDITSNRKKYNEDLKAMWLEWHRDGKNHFFNLSLESLKSMLILTGAAIIYSFSVLSGEVSNPESDAVIVAKVTIFYSVVSMIMTALGHAINSWALNFSTSRIRGVIIGNIRHKRLYALHKYMAKYYDPLGIWANAMIYGAMAVFGFGALVSALLMF